MARVRKRWITGRSNGAPTSGMYLARDYCGSTSSPSRTLSGKKTLGPQNCFALRWKPRVASSSLTIRKMGSFLYAPAAELEWYRPTTRPKAPLFLRPTKSVREPPF